MSMARYVFTVSVDKGRTDYGKAKAGTSRRITESREFVRKNKAAIISFLGVIRMTDEMMVVPTYYSELLAWTLKHHLERKHWQIIRVLGYRYSEPLYADIRTDYHKNEKILLDGQLLIENGDQRLVITVDARACFDSLLIVEGSNKNRCEIKELVDGIKVIVEKENYYRNKRVAFNGRIQFMDIRDESWGNINLSPLMKAEIKASIIDLFDNKQTWSKHSIPLRRCVLITGGAIKDKVAICQALITGAVGITCITTNACDLDYDCAVQLYRLARDLSPCIVFIKDIDRIGQGRIKSDHYRGPAVLYLVTLLASVEEYEKIVTVATTSYSDAFRKAILC